MSIMKRLKEEKADKRKSNRNGQEDKRNRTFITFHPTKEEKETITLTDLSLTNALDEITDFMEGRFSLTLQEMLDKPGYVLMLRDKSTPYPNGMTLAVFHATALKCFQQMAYALGGPYAEFPDGVYQYTFNTDW